jgi:hypothetical protein
MTARLDPSAGSGNLAPDAVWRLPSPVPRRQRNLDWRTRHSERMEQLEQSFPMAYAILTASESNLRGGYRYSCPKPMRLTHRTGGGYALRYQAMREVDAGAPLKQIAATLRIPLSARRLRDRELLTQLLHANSPAGRMLMHPLVIQRLSPDEPLHSRAVAALGRLYREPPPSVFAGADGEQGSQERHDQFFRSLAAVAQRLVEPAFATDLDEAVSEVGPQRFIAAVLDRPREGIPGAVRFAQRAIDSAPATTPEHTSLLPPTREWVLRAMQPVYRGLAITPLLSRADLEQEGRAMRHCVGNYAEFLAAGTGLLFSVKPPPGDAIKPVTVEVAWGKITQAKTEGNGQPSKAMRELLDKWAELHRLELLVAQGLAEPCTCCGFPIDRRLEWFARGCCSTHAAEVMARELSRRSSDEWDVP